MNAVAEQSQYNSVDKAKLWTAIAVAVAACIAFALLADRFNIWLRLLGLLVAFVAAGGIVWFSNYGPALREYFVESHFEMRKVVWPTRKESWQTTWVVFIMIAIIALLLFIFDSALSWVFLDFIYGGGK